MTQKLIYVGPELCSHQLTPMYVFFGEAPGAQEELSGRPFMGRSGQFLRKSIAEMGIDLADCHFSNVVKVRPKDNRPPTKEELDSWMGSIREEVERLIFPIKPDPPKFMALGKSAIYVLDQLDIDYYGLAHPSYALRFGKTEEWKKALKEFLK